MTDIVISVVVSILGILEVCTYFLYCYELKRCCSLISINAGKLCWIPYLNKFKLIQLEDIECDKLLRVPYIGIGIRREVIVLVNVLSPLMVCISSSVAAFVGVILFVLTNILIWSEIGYEFDEKLEDSIFYLIGCSCFGIHLFQWLRLYKLDKVLQGAESSEEYTEEEYTNEESEEEVVCAGNEVEEEVEYASDYFERIFGEQ